MKRARTAILAVWNGKRCLSAEYEWGEAVRRSKMADIMGIPNGVFSISVARLIKEIRSVGGAVSYKPMIGASIDEDFEAAIIAALEVSDARRSERV